MKHVGEPGRIVNNQQPIVNYQWGCCGGTAVDNLSNNALEAVGWKILRYSTKQINEQAESYCLPNVVKTINDLGGVEEGSVAARKIDPDAGVFQPSLFD